LNRASGNQRPSNLVTGKTVAMEERRLGAKNTSFLLTHSMGGDGRAKGGKSRNGYRSKGGRKRPKEDGRDWVMRGRQQTKREAKGQRDGAFQFEGGNGERALEGKRNCSVGVANNEGKF